MVKNLFSFVSTLSGVQRFSMLKQCHTENVLEHTGMMCVFAYTLGNRINAAAKGKPLDMQLVMRSAIVHDWDEVITGDVPRPTKYHTEQLRSEMERLAAAGIELISQKFGLPCVTRDWKEAKADREGFIIKVCDIACAVHRIWEEALVYNNKHFVLPARRTHRVLGVIMQDEMKFRFSHEQWSVIKDFAQELVGILMRVTDNELEEFIK